MFFSASCPRFYLGKHVGRKISLHSNLGYAELSACFYGPIDGAGTPLGVAQSDAIFPALRGSSSASSSVNILASGLPGSPGVAAPEHLTLDTPGSSRPNMRKYILQVGRTVYYFALCALYFTCFLCGYVCLCFAC